MAQGQRRATYHEAPQSLYSSTFDYLPPFSSSPPFFPIYVIGTQRQLELTSKLRSRVAGGLPLLWFSADLLTLAAAACTAALRLTFGCPRKQALASVALDTKKDTIWVREVQAAK